MDHILKLFPLPGPALEENPITADEYASQDMDGFDLEANTGRCFKFYPEIVPLFVCPLRF